VAGTCEYGEGLSGSINAGNFLTSCKVYWLASQEGLCSMEQVSKYIYIYTTIKVNLFCFGFNIDRLPAAPFRPSFSMKSCTLFSSPSARKIKKTGYITECRRGGICTTISESNIQLMQYCRYL